jgi:hypothetical protein
MCRQPNGRDVRKIPEFWDAGIEVATLTVAIAWSHTTCGPS